MSFRTLRFGDRTISYDAGLDLVAREESSSRQNKLISIDPQYDDDGIGTSDDETGSNSSANNNNNNNTDVDSGEDDSGANSVTHEDVESDAKSASSTINSSAAVAALKSRRVIKPDFSAISRLLAFDEEEEDDCEEEDDTAQDCDDIPKPKQKSSQPQHNPNWHKTIARDLARLTSPTSGPNRDEPRRVQLTRRHSITLCESRRHRKIYSSVSSPPASGGINSGPMSMQNHAPLSNHTSGSSMTTSESTSPTRGGEFSLNVSNFTINNNNDDHSSMTSSDSYAPDNTGLKTLNLRLDEVAHIRAALTKAELEGIDAHLRADIERGKVCFLCMKTRFGLFGRGYCCELCKQIVCQKCQAKMHIPLEHFSTTPVFALSPTTSTSPTSTVDGRTGVSTNDSSLKFQSLMTSPTTSTNCREKKMSLPDSLGLLNLQSAGSAPSSPGLHRRGVDGGPAVSAVPTISSVVGFTPVSTGSNANFGPLSLPATAATISSNPYATLPKKNRRLSWMTSRDVHREKLEGVPLTLCLDCKEMVVQVIRVSHSTRRLQMARSAFFSLTPDSYRDRRP